MSENVTPQLDAETARLAALRHYCILDTPAEQTFDDLALLASQICDTPIALITLIDETRQWFKSKVGLRISETSLDVSFCAHAIRQTDLFVVRDASKDKRFAANPFVLGDPSIRFYAGAPLVTADGHVLGTLCVIDRVPRVLNAEQEEALRVLARQAVAQIELRHAQEELRSLSLIDDLTGLHSRRSFFALVIQHLKLMRTRRYDQNSMLLFADLDGLKSINDAHGHAAGSLAITRAGEILRRTFRDSDIIARLGGDEFAALVIEAGQDDEEMIRVRLNESFARHNAERTLPFDLSLSVGTIFITPGETASLEELLARADAAMYEEKRRRGKART